ncbi:hypothetical protein F511_28615 [Dorcoceras hygrometricum]|uniref:Uncharacterized protein n=1 Tax=Dorcoceras hygrometricum TaxID=472368 RepID=A0A2Z7A9S5_9LAMI|nr:hypothetical protein F511_28615 [Dorcoceras hygrometricum]
MVSMKNPLAAILDSNRFTGLNYQDWLRNLKLVLASEKLLYTIEKPKNLKFQNRSKPGPTSHTGPKTSRAARDRPELDPKRIQTSRHDIAGDSPERRPACGATTTKIAAAACGAARNNAPQTATSRINFARPRASGRLSTHEIARPARVQRGQRRFIGRATCAATERPTCSSNSQSPAPHGLLARRLAQQIAPICIQARARDVSHEEEPPYAAAGGQSQGLDFNSENSKIAVDYRQSGPRPDPRLLRQAALEALTRSARTDSPRKTRPERFPTKLTAAGGARRRRDQEREAAGFGV